MLTDLPEWNAEELDFAAVWPRRQPRPSTASLIIATSSKPETTASGSETAAVALMMAIGRPMVEDEQQQAGLEGLPVEGNRIQNATQQSAATSGTLVRQDSEARG
jgi:hypothetical protein